MIDAVALTGYVPPPDITVPVLSGCVAFGGTLAVSTLVQKLIGISTATQVVPSVLGVATVCVASLASERAAILGHDRVQNWQASMKKKSWYSTTDKKKKANGWLSTSSSSSSSSSLAAIRQKEYYEVGDYVKIPKHHVRVMALGILAFKLLGGRFWAISPSSYTHLGSFARWSVPCTERYATPSQRALLEQMGRRWGCHTCGSRMLFSNQPFKFVGDHMPPKSVANQMNKVWFRRMGLWPKVQFRFYPQCVNCSNTQGSVLAKASNELANSNSVLPFFMRAANLKASGGGRMAHYHGLRPRLNHLTGGVIAGTTVIGATNSEIKKGNPARLTEAETWLRNKVQNAIQRR